MLKKIMLAAVLMFTAVSLFAAPKVQVKQNTKEAACETFLRSLVYGDADALFALLTKEDQKDALEEYGSKKKLFKEIEEEADLDNEVKAQIKTMLNDKAMCAELVKELLKEVHFKKVGFKWYLDLEE